LKRDGEIRGTSNLVILRHSIADLGSVFIARPTLARNFYIRDFDLALVVVSDGLFDQITLELFCDWPAIGLGVKPPGETALFEPGQSAANVDRCFRDLDIEVLTRADAVVAVDDRAVLIDGNVPSTRLEAVSFEARF
jgi:hypothetical protein